MLFFVVGISKLNAQNPCDADHTVLLINYEFSYEKVFFEEIFRPLTDQFDDIFTIFINFF